MKAAVRPPVSTDCDCDRPARQHLIPVDQALATILADVAPISRTVVVPVTQARGRILSAAIASAAPLPRFDNSAMDGYGVHANDLSGRAVRLRLTERIAAGSGPMAALSPGQAVQLLTGAPLPSGVAAVVPHEQTSRHGRDVVIDTPVASGDNIRRAGEDVAVGQQLVSAGTRIDARHVALLLAAGIVEIAVKPKVRVGLLSTGNELVETGQTPEGHTIIDTNRPLLSGLLDSPDVELKDCGIVRDSLKDVSERIRRVAAGCDLLITTGGICGSDADHIAPAIRAAGGTCEPLKLALRPGKPIGVGRIGGTHILCLPGNPLSALVTTVLLVRPLLLALAGASRKRLRGIPAFAADRIRHVPGRTEFVPVVIEGTDTTGHCYLASLPRGSHRLSSLVAADGFAEIPRDVGDVRPGERLTFHPFAVDFSV